MTARTNLHESLTLVAGWLRGSALAFAAANVRDPLRIDLPPLLGPGQPASITAAELRALAALYLDAELEQTGVLVVTEALAGVRDQLQFVGADAVRRLDDFARSRTAWERARRDALFARLFGIGGGAKRDAAAINNDFLQSFTSLCVALVRYDEEDRLLGNPSATREAQLRYAASSVLFNLGQRQSGVTAIAAREIHEQMQHALAILADRTVLTQFHAQSVWDLLRLLLDASAADNGRIVRRATSGVQIFEWLATVMASLNAPAGSRLVMRGAPVVGYAAQWLEATGVTSATAIPTSMEALAS